MMNDFDIGDTVGLRDNPDFKGTITAVLKLSNRICKYWVETAEEKETKGKFYLKAMLTKKTEKQDDDTLRQQTEIFWLLQLQLLEMSRWHLRLTFWSIQHLPTYKKNKITHKLSSKVDHTWNYDEETRQCLATHIALQLAGVEE
jgi:hypothetical protein